MPHQAASGEHERGRGLLVLILALPVLGWVYAASATGWLRSTRPAVLVVALVAMSAFGEILLGGSASAVTPAAFRPLPQDALGTLPPAPTPAPTARTLPPVTAADEGVLVMPLVAQSSDPTPSPDPTATPAPAAVVRFRPLEGQAGVAPPSQVSVRFTVAMDQPSTEAAFAVAVDGKVQRGSIRWAEGDTVLVFTPSTPIPYGARVHLSVATTARSSSGAALGAVGVATFTTMAEPPKATSAPAAAKPAPSPTPRPAAPAAPAGWRWPLVGTITQYFGQSLTIYGFHQGIDIAGQTGDPVRAARAGTVIAAGHVASDTCGGIQVRIDHGGGFVSWYHHLSAVLVHVGQQVAAGDLIGRVGATGCAFGSHLHFAVLLNGMFKDPLLYLPPR